MRVSPPAPAASASNRIVLAAIAALTGVSLIFIAVYAAQGKCPHAHAPVSATAAAAVGEATGALVAQAKAANASAKAAEEALYTALHAKFDFINMFTKVRHPEYEKGFWGIANSIKGDQFFYGDVKTRFLFEQLRARVHNTSIKTICELGFNAGHSAAIFLDSVPGARLVEFDWGETKWAAENQAMFKEAYGERFTYIQGLSTDVLPAYIANGTHPLCDAIFVDGGKGEELRRLDVRNFAKLAHNETLLFGDEANTVECVSGKVKADDPLCQPGYFIDTAWAWNKMVRDGLIKFHACSKPAVAADLMCLWTYTAKGLQDSKW